MPKNKAPGLDKITLNFIIDCLPSIIQPITDIINSSLTQGIFPKAWKIAEIIPIPKTDEAEPASNNRPISLLPILSKICERVVHQQFTNYLTINKLLSTHQNGNKRYHSTETLGLQITDDILNAMDRKEITAMILLDLSKAYDSISHPLLVAKLKSIGVSGITLDWFISYLSDREQQVRIESDLSEPLPVKYGVPQGSILGPLLFNIYTNELSSATTNASVKSYVDDTKLYLSFPLKELNDGLVRLKEDLNKVTGWCSTNQLLINPDKTQFILFGVNQLLRHVPLNVELPFLDKILKPAGHVKDLGITLDQSLSYSSHINETVSSCHFKLSQIRRVKHLLDKATLELVIQSLVLSKLLYCSTVWSSTSRQNIQKLQHIQNFAARIITGEPKFCHITPILHNLCWIPIPEIIYLREAVMTYKCINNLVPEYLSSNLDSCRIKNKAYNTRSKDELRPPKCRIKNTERTFIFRACKLWNSLEEQERQLKSLPQFKLRKQ